MSSAVIYRTRTFAAALLLFLVTTVFCQSLVHIGDSDVTTSDNPQKVVTTEDNHGVDVDKFLPTHDWQTIKDGQSIPKGLHVRMNLETGLKEAKLMEDPKQLDQKALEQALKNIATSHDEPHSNKQSADSANNDKNTYRSLEEITSEFASHKIAISSEQEILGKLLADLIETNSTSQIITILNDVEYYVHSVDNANYFADAGGTQLLVNKLSNTTDTELVAALCLTLGAAAHTNPHVSDRLADTGAIDILLKHLEMFGSSGGEVAVRRIIFALSAVSCSSSNGMRSFISSGGLPLFSAMASKNDLSLKVTIKIYTFLSDLIGDADCSKRLTDSGHTADDLQSDLVDICRQSSLLLPKVHQLGYLEKLLHFVKVVTGNRMCYSLSEDILHSLESTESMLKSRSIDVVDSEYAGELLDSITSIRKLISLHQSHHVEL